MSRLPGALRLAALAQGPGCAGLLRSLRDRDHRFLSEERSHETKDAGDPDGRTITR
ncbi:MAG: hypothetical protein JST25_02805 [Actinobacteria bacterium]|nr:hypothetical protein [Actinomycetota bacterium]